MRINEVNENISLFMQLFLYFLTITVVDIRRSQLLGSQTPVVFTLVQAVDMRGAS